jgi:hypothetical protein
VLVAEELETDERCRPTVVAGSFGSSEIDRDGSLRRPRRET